MRNPKSKLHFLLLTSLFVLYTSSQLIDFSNLSKSDRRLFIEFKQKYKKKYKSEEEFRFRFKIFVKNLRILQDEPTFTAPNGTILLGSAGPFSRRRRTSRPKKYRKGVNQFIDLTDDEFKDFYLLPKDTIYRKTHAQQHKRSGGLLGGSFPFFSQDRNLQESSIGNLPLKVDWREKGVCGKVKSQSRCNSCYAFAALEAVEVRQNIKSKSNVVLSVQEILDCSTDNFGCTGGQPSAALEYIVENGVSFDEDYPYAGKENKECYAKHKKVPLSYMKETEEKNERRLQEENGFEAMMRSYMQRYASPPRKKRRRRRRRRSGNRNGYTRSGYRSYWSNKGQRNNDFEDGDYGRNRFNYYNRRWKRENKPVRRHEYNYEREDYNNNKDLNDRYSEKKSEEYLSEVEKFNRQVEELKEKQQQEKQEEVKEVKIESRAEKARRMREEWRKRREEKKLSEREKEIKKRQEIERKEKVRREQQERLQKERDERIRKQHQERLEKKKEERLQREKEERFQREKEERIRKEEQERLRRKEEERFDKEEQERLQREREERLRKEKEERLKREEEERLRREQERLQREEEEKLQREEEERLRKEEEERIEREEEERIEREEEERLQREEQERLQREEQERLRKEEQARLRREEEERLKREEEEERLRKEEQARLKKEKEERLKREKEERLKREKEERLKREKEEKLKREEEERLRKEEEERLEKEKPRKKFKGLKSYSFLTENVLALLHALQNGPVVVALHVSSAFKFYSQGVFDGEGCEKAELVNHAVALVGYNLEAETPYFLFKNSWSELWGDEGYFKMAIGELNRSNKGLCLLANNPFNLVPEVE